MAMEAIKWNPKSAKLHSQLGIFIAEYDDTARKNSNFIKQKSMFKNAEGYLKRAVELEPKNSKFWTNLGKNY